MMKYFRSSIVVTVVGFVLAGFYAWQQQPSLTFLSSTLFLVFVLCILEVSLSLDNAVVNAAVLEKMTPLWQRRFLTWGMLIAVFGMRVVFPLLLVGVLANLSPWAALKMALFQPTEYAAAMKAMHVSVSAFGGSFLMMVALKFFFDKEKEVHWLHNIEKKLVFLGRMEAIEAALVLILVLVLSRFLPEHDSQAFLKAGLWGVIAYIGVDGFAALLALPSESEAAIERAGLGLFLYLNVLDSSFSFDGVVGAFAISNNLVIISIGLGIGAMFVRSLTILLVEKKTLAKFLYLEHGAFWAVFVLALIMFLSTFWHIPEALTGLIGAVLIGLSLWSSVRINGADLKHK